VVLLRERARRSLTHRLDRSADEIASHLSHVRACSPLSTLRRGYAVVQRASGDVVTDVAGIDVDEQLSVRVAAGRLDVTVRGTTPIDQSGTTTEESP
jgi:exodeoxyribonuclease VII large subunit